jgi:hypothetical protein
MPRALPRSSAAAGRSRASMRVRLGRLDVTAGHGCHIFWLNMLRYRHFLTSALLGHLSSFGAGAKGFQWCAVPAVANAARRSDCDAIGAVLHWRIEGS